MYIVYIKNKHKNRENGTFFIALLFIGKDSHILEKYFLFFMNLLEIQHKIT